MKLIHTISVSFLLLMGLTSLGQNDRFNDQYTPPFGSFFSEDSLMVVDAFGQLKKPRKYAVNRFTAWDIIAFTKGAFVVEQGIRLGESRFMIHAHLGKNVLPDVGQRMKFGLWGRSKSLRGDADPADVVRFGLVDFSKFNIYSQLSLTWDFKYSNAGLELGCRFINYVVDVPRSERIGVLFGWDYGTVHEVDDVPITVFTPYLGFNVLDPSTHDRNMASMCFGIGVDFYTFRDFNREFDPGAFGGYNLVPGEKYNYTPIPIIFIAISYGGGNRAK